MPDKAASSPRCDIALVISDLRIGGAQRVAATLANAWARDGRRVAVVTFDGSGHDFFKLDGAVERVGLGLLGASRSPLHALAANWRRVASLRRAIEQTGAAVILSFVGTTNVLAVLATRGLAVRLVACERNDPARQSLGRPWDWLRRQLYRRADLVTANNREALEAMRAYVPAGKLRALPNPLAVDGAQSVAASDPPVILSIGRLDHQKGYDVLLEAFARSVARCEGWRLALMGRGTLEADLRQQAERLDLGGQIEWRSISPDPAAHYAGAGIFVMSSRHEGMPNVVLEAMAMGRPVIVTDRCGGALDYVVEGESGLVVPAEDAQALADAIDRLVADPALRHRLGVSARHAVAACRLERVLPLWDEAIAWPGPAAQTTREGNLGRASLLTAKQQQSAKST